MEINEDNPDLKEHVTKQIEAQQQENWKAELEKESRKQFEREIKEKYLKTDSTKGPEKKPSKLRRAANIVSNFGKMFMPAKKIKSYNSSQAQKYFSNTYGYSGRQPRQRLRQPKRRYAPQQYTRQYNPYSENRYERRLAYEQQKLAQMNAQAQAVNGMEYEQQLARLKEAQQQARLRYTQKSNQDFVGLLKTQIAPRDNLLNVGNELKNIKLNAPIAKPQTKSLKLWGGRGSDTDFL